MQHPFTSNIENYYMRVALWRYVMSSLGVFLLGALAGALLVGTLARQPVDLSECPSALAPATSLIPPARP